MSTISHFYPSGLLCGILPWMAPSMHAAGSVRKANWPHASLCACIHVVLFWAGDGLEGALVVQPEDSSWKRGSCPTLLQHAQMAPTGHLANMGRTMHEQPPIPLLRAPPRSTFPKGTQNLLSRIVVNCICKVLWGDTFLWQLFS